MQPAHAAYSAVVAGLKHYYIDISYLVLTMTIVRYHGTRWAVAAYAHLKHVHPTPQLMAEAHLYVRLTSQLMAGAHLYVHPTSQLMAGAHLYVHPTSQLTAGGGLYVHPILQLMAGAHLYVHLTSQLMAGGGLYVHPTSQLMAAHQLTQPATARTSVQRETACYSLPASSVGCLGCAHSKRRYSQLGNQHVPKTAC